MRTPQLFQWHNEDASPKIWDLIQTSAGVDTRQLDHGRWSSAVPVVGRSTLPTQSCSASRRLAACASTSRPLSPGLLPAISRHRASQTSLGGSSHVVMAVDDRSHAAIKACSTSTHVPLMPTTRSCCSGQLQSEVTCGGCGAVSYCFEDFLDLSLPIPSGRKTTIQVQDAEHIRC